MEPLGDAVNWELLIDALPDGEDIHVISEDGDFYSAIHEEAPLPFLVAEWSERKSGRLLVYRTLSAFMREHFDGVAFSFDKQKEAYIDSLAQSGSFATTHGLIAQLENYGYFSAREVVRILEAAVQNDQFGLIVSDADIVEFLRRVALPHIASVTSEEQQEVLKKVGEDEG